MSRHASIKVTTDLIDDAKLHAGVFQRSVGGQVEHWAKVGRAVEASPEFSVERVARLLVDASTFTAFEPSHWKVARLEAAIEVLGFQIADLSADIATETKKANPNQEKIAELRAKRVALSDEQDDLRPQHIDRIAEILGDKGA